MKKLLSLGATSVLVFSLTAACGDEEEEETPTQPDAGMGGGANGGSSGSSSGGAPAGGSAGASAGGGAGVAGGGTAGSASGGTAGAAGATSGVSVECSACAAPKCVDETTACTSDGTCAACWAVDYQGAACAGNAAYKALCACAMKKPGGGTCADCAPFCP
jgi:hypothetical protein